MMTEGQMLAGLRAVVNCRGGQSRLAERCGVQPQYISGIVSGRFRPSDKVLAGLGLRRVVLYEVIEPQAGEGEA